MYGRGETVTHFVGTVASQGSKGNDVITYDDGTDIPNCPVWPTGSTEQVQHQDQVTAGLSVMVPKDTCVAAIDQFEVRGKRYDVDGDPDDWRSPFTGRRPGLEVQLTRITG